MVHASPFHECRKVSRAFISFSDCPSRVPVSRECRCLLFSFCQPGTVRILMNHYQNDMNNMAWMFILIQRVYSCFLVIYYIERRDTCCDVIP
jgi:hypothetical protein